MTVACQTGKHVELIHRVKEINGELMRPEGEAFRPHLLRQYGSCLGAADMALFIDWMITSSLGEVKLKDHIIRRLQEIRHTRMARLHVYCADGRVPAEKSMSPFYAESALLAFIQGTRTPSENWS